MLGEAYIKEHAICIIVFVSHHYNSSSKLGNTEPFTVNSQQ